MFPITKLELFNKSLSEINKDNITFNDISESKKTATTEVQTITLRKKTNAQKCREYRERKKLQNTMVQNITAERSEFSETDQLQGKKPKTNAERRKKHYEAQKLKNQESKKIPKTSKQRSKEYYYRKKKIQAFNTLNHRSDVSRDNCTAKICKHPEEILKNAEEKQQNNSFHVPYQQFRNCAQSQDHLVQNQLPSVSSTLDSLVDVKVCRVCLAMDVKMYDMSKHQLNIMFERVTGIEMNTGNKLPQKLCWECIARLASANNFVEKVLKTQWILFNIINSRKFTVISGMESIKETRNQLKPTLSIVSRVDDYYLDIIEKSAETIIENPVNDKEEQTNSEFEEIQIKNEHLDIDFEVAVVEDEVNDRIYGVKLENNFEEFDMKVENLSDDISQENQSEMHCGKMEVILPDVLVHDYKQHNHIVNSTTLSKNTDQTIYDPEKFICDLCGKIFKRKSIFINHIFKHPKTYTCSHCSYKAPNKTRYNQHINARHTKTISFKCSLCNYTTNLKQSLSRHVNNKHNNKNIYKCPLCNFKTYNDKSLGKHVGARHTNKLYKCSLCNYTANIKYCLAKHVSVVHNRSKSFKCSTCNFKSFYKTSLDRHVRLFHS